MSTLRIVNNFLLWKWNHNSEKMFVSLLKLENELKKLQIRSLQKATQLAFQKVRLKTPVDTGNLRRSWNIQKIIIERNIHRQAIENDLNQAPYGPYVEYGHVTSHGTYVNGQYMTLQTKKEMESEFKKIVQKEMNQFLLQNDFFNL